MGLDISYYSGVTLAKAGHRFEDGQCFSDEHIRAYNLREFRDHGEGLSEIEVSRSAVWYACVTAKSEEGFRAGSYSGYGAWREQLSLMVFGHPAEHIWANAKQFIGEPFFELINFSDCEGAIGPVVSAKLAKDFREGRPLISTHLSPYFKEAYDLWLNAFETARQDGLVLFH